MTNYSFAQTCENYDNVTYRHLTFHQNYQHPPLYRHPTPFPVSINRNTPMIQGIRYIQETGATNVLYANAIKPPKIYSKAVIEDVFNLKNKPDSSNNFDFMDSDSDVSVDSDTSNFSDLAEAPEAAAVEANAVEANAVEATPADAYTLVTPADAYTLADAHTNTSYCRNCYQKLKTKIKSKFRVKFRHNFTQKNTLV